MNGQQMAQGLIDIQASGIIKNMTVTERQAALYGGNALRIKKEHIVEYRAHYKGQYGGLGRYAEIIRGQYKRRDGKLYERTYFRAEFGKAERA